MSENEIRLILAARLKECREKAGFTINEVGVAIGKSEKTISAWEHGRGQPDADMLFKLCDLYGIHDIGIFYGKSVVDTSHGVSRLPSPASVLTPDESELLRLYRCVNEDGQCHILETAKLVAGNPAMKKGSIERAT